MFKMTRWPSNLIFQRISLSTFFFQYHFGVDPYKIYTKLYGVKRECVTLYYK